jgi:hypothetical protein
MHRESWNVGLHDGTFDMLQLEWKIMGIGTHSIILSIPMSNTQFNFRSERAMKAKPVPTSDNK